MRQLIPSGPWQVAQLAARLDSALVQSEVAAQRREAERWRELCEHNAGWRDAVVGRLIRPQARCAPFLPSTAAPPHCRTTATPPWLAQPHTACGRCLSHCRSAAAPSQLDDMLQQLRQLQQLQQRHEDSTSLPGVDAQGAGAGHAQPSQPSSACSASPLPASGAARAADKAGVTSVAALQEALQEKMACRTRLLRVKASLST